MALPAAEAPAVATEVVTAVTVTTETVTVVRATTAASTSSATLTGTAAVVELVAYSFTTLLPSSLSSSQTCSAGGEASC